MEGFIILNVLQFIVRVANKTSRVLRVDSIILQQVKPLEPIYGALQIYYLLLRRFKTRLTNTWKQLDC